MKKYLIALLLVCSSYLSAAGWNASPGTIPLGTSNGAQVDVTMAYYPKIKKVVAAWADNIIGGNFYSTFDGTSWSPGIAFTTPAFTAQGNVTLQSFPFEKIVVAAWQSTLDQKPYSSLFDGTVWTTPALIGDGTVFVRGDIGMTYDKLLHEVVAGWIGSNNTLNQEPFYSILSTSLTWIQPQPIDPTQLTNLFGNGSVNLTYDKGTQQVVAAWGYSNANIPSAPALPYYATFNGTSWSSSATPANPIPLNNPPNTNSDGIHFDVRMIYAANVNRVFAAWGDYGPPFDPYKTIYDMFDGTSWLPVTGPLLLPNGGQGVNNYNISLGYNTNTGDVFYAWGASQNLTGLPYYNINATSAAAIPNGGFKVNADVNLMYDQNSKKMIAVWTNGVAGQPYFNTYQ